MLIVCPSCATSYMIDPASVGTTGRMVRCARCKETWFAGAPAKDVTAYVDSVIAEAEAETNPAPPPPPEPPAAADDFRASAMPAMPQASDFVVPGSEAGQYEEQSPPPEPVAISDAPSLVPPVEHPDLGPPAHAEAEAEAEDIETFAARRRRLQSRRKKSRRTSRWTALVLVLFAFNVALIGARHEVVRYLPQTASLFAAIGLPVNLRNLNFEGVRIAKETEGGALLLVVEGRIVAAGSKPVEVPRLRFAARNAAGQEIYVWTARPERSILAPGESIKFSSRLASPPADANDVMVRFFTPQDAMAGGHK
ncbi:MAG: MJ0042-type zinc finger domain-containing protein [Pseudolabrys sp.]